MSENPVVLLVEDDHIIRLVTMEVLADAGFSVIATANGADAFAALDKDAAGIVAIITDIGLGNGADGWAVARHARELIPEMAIVYVSGAHGDDWASQGVPDSIMIAKPYAPAQIVTAVATLMNAAGSR